MPDEEKLITICRRFRIGGEPVFFRPVPSGHINSAFHAAFDDGRETRQYLVQRINHYVFRDPVGMMRNIDLIGRHLAQRDPSAGPRERLHFHRTEEGDLCLLLGEGGGAEYWRVCDYIDGSVIFESGEGNARVLRMAGKAFGRFDRLLSDLDPGRLIETIPHFHDTELRMETLFRTVEEDPFSRAAKAEREIALIRDNRDFAGTLCRKIRSGELPVRVTHNDTKTNNVLFDRDTLEPLAVIDLDTCMPGAICFDFGDAIRFAACTAGEDEPDKGRMKLDLALAEAFTEGFLGETADVLTDAELDSLATGAAVITLELASRFLEDYLAGDRYFRTAVPGQNLTRARSQLALFEDMMRQENEMRAVISACAARHTLRRREA